MKPIKTKKIMIAMMLLCATHIAMGSFTGSSDRKSSKLFSLKNFNKNFYHTSSSFSLASGYTFKGFQIISQKKEANGDVSFHSMLRYEKGNTTYIYPYKHKINVAKFKVPSPEIR